MLLSRLLVAIEHDDAEVERLAAELDAVCDRRSARLEILKRVMEGAGIWSGHFADKLYRFDRLAGSLAIEPTTYLGSLELDLDLADVPAEVRELAAWDAAFPGVPAEAGAALDAALAEEPPVAPTWAYPRNFEPEVDTPVERLRFAHPDEDDAEETAAALNSQAVS